MLLILSKDPSRFIRRKYNISNNLIKLEFSSVSMRVNSHYEVLLIFKDPTTKSEQKTLDITLSKIKLMFE